MLRLFAASAVLLAGACATEVVAPETEVVATETEPLPPHAIEGLEPIFGPTYQAMGLRLTRGSLHDPGDYSVSPDGTHLALYVEPTEEWTPERYVSAVMPTLRPLVPEVFERWPALESFDICLELPLEPGADGVPEAATQVVVDRAGLAAARWEEATLAELVAASRATDDLAIVVSDLIAGSAAWRAVERG